MTISYSESKSGPASSSPYVIIRRDDGCKIAVKENNGGEWSFNGLHYYKMETRLSEWESGQG
jgi:hypothetical protein